MTHDYGPKEEGAYTYRTDDCSDELSGKYTEYIKNNLDVIRKKCEHFTTCIDKLLQDESVLLVLKGENISLNKTCSLVYKDGPEDYGSLGGKCTSEERDDIRAYLEGHLKDQFASNEWRNVRKCLSNSYGDKERKTYVDEICGLAYRQNLLCRNYNTHKTVETFFNDQIQHLRCTCKSLTDSDHSPAGLGLPLILGAGVGGVLLLIILLFMCFICYRRRRSQKKKKRSPNVIYLPAPNADNCPVYQEVYDVSRYQGYGQTPSTTPPTLPMRYTPHPSAASNLSQRREDEAGYLEPVEAGARFRPRPPLPSIPKANPGYDAPPQYSETDTESRVVVTEDDHGYFQPLPSPTEDEDKGYDTLGRHRSDPESLPAAYETVDGARSSVPIEDAPVPGDVPLGPVPAKRTKKDDRQIESHYFELEKVERDDDRNSTSTNK